jgi:hypothetical protein
MKTAEKKEGGRAMKTTTAKQREGIRATMIRRMVNEIRTSKSSDVMLSAEELLDNQNRPYGRQFSELGYDVSDAKRRRFFADLRKAVHETF